MNKWKSLILLTLFQFSIFKTYAANSEPGAWLGTFADTSISKVFSVWAETQMRWGFYDGGVTQLLYRVGLIQNNLGDKHRLGYLYGYVRTEDLKENRFTLQHTMNYENFLDLSFSHRLRLEARYFGGYTGAYPRFRYLLRAEQPSTNNFNLVIWDEIFINLNNKELTGGQVIDQNRFCIGLKHGILGNNRYEFGYLNQYFPRKSLDFMQQVLVFYYFFEDDKKGDFFVY